MHPQSNISVMTERMEDEHLVEQTIRNDEACFESLVEQYSEDVALLANRVLGWPGEVEDVTQEVFLAVFMGLKNFRYDCSIKTWLFTITINKCRSFRYKQLFSRQKKITKQNLRLPPAADRKMLDNETFEKIASTVESIRNKIV